MALVGGLDQFVDELGGQGVADPVALLGGDGAKPDEQVRLAGAGVADQAQGFAVADPGAAGHGVDGRGGDVGVGVEVEVVQVLGAGEAGFFDAAGAAAPVAVVAFGQQQLGEEAAVGELLAFGGVGQFGEAVADGRQPQQAAGLVDGRVSGLLGDTTASRAHERLLGVSGLVSSWS